MHAPCLEFQRGPADVLRVDLDVDNCEALLKVIQTLGKVS